MPIYEYECLKSGHRFEEWQKIDSPPATTCKVCGGKVKKVISKTSFLLKGGGWYRDGYASSNGSANRGSVSKESKTSPKTESKPSSGTGSSEKTK